MHRKLTIGDFITGSFIMSVAAGGLIVIMLLLEAVCA